MSSIKPNDGGGQINRGEEVASGFVIAGGDGAILFQAAEEVLNEMPRLIEFLVVKALFFTIFLRWNDDGLSGCAQRVDNPFIGVVSLVGQERGGVQRQQKHLCALQIASRSGGEAKASRIAQSIHRRVDFRAQPAFAASDGGVFAFFLGAPALC